MLACVANFAGEPHRDYRLGLPSAGRWLEVLNTDAGIYGGSGVGNLGAVEATAEPWHGRPASAAITVPPMGVVWLAPDPDAAGTDPAVPLAAVPEPVLAVRPPAPDALAAPEADPGPAGEPGEELAG